MKKIVLKITVPYVVDLLNGMLDLLQNRVTKHLTALETIDWK